MMFKPKDGCCSFKVVLIVHLLSVSCLSTTVLACNNLLLERQLYLDSTAVCAGLSVSAVAVDAAVDVIRTDDSTESASFISVDSGADVKSDTDAVDNSTAVESLGVNGRTDTAGDVNPCTEAYQDIENNCFLCQLTDASNSGMAPASKRGAVFLKSSWRQKLCRCPSCLVNYCCLINFYMFTQLFIFFKEVIYFFWFVVTS